MANNLFEGQGKIYMGARNASGDPESLFWVGDAPNFVIEQAEEVEEVKDSYSGLKSLIARIGKGVTNTVKMTLRDIQKQNLKIAFRGTDLSISGTSVSNESLGDGSTSVAVGDYLKLANPNATSIVLTDSTGSPVTLTLGTHYEITDADFGIIKILSLSGLTQPIKAAYTRAATTGVVLHDDDTEDEYYIYFTGLNITSKPHKKVGVELWRVSFSPAALLALITEEVATFELTGAVLVDSTREDNSAFGPYGRITYVDALA